ncbi:LysR family transcriptional regulator [Streptomyces sp. NPDC088923]|uniref:LysR family transcriptional regulator n=1 Tax=Streptomyces sp. NPDC088923 TaxID=3365913 RepID=UPI00380A254B
MDPLAGMDLTALRSFREVHRRGAIGLAAAALGYTQSAVSRQLSALEARLGVTLLERHARGVRLTPAGHALLPHAVALLARAERAAREVAALAGRDMPPLRAGAVPSVSAALLPAAFTRYREARPGARAVFAEDTTPHLLPRVHDGELDLAVVTDYPPGLPAHSGLTVTHLFDEPLWCLLPTGHPLAAHAVADLAALADEPWVEDYEGAASLLTAAAARAGFTPRAGVECGGWLGKQGFVATGHGVALVPRSLVPALRPGLVARPLTDPPVRAVHGAVRAGERGTAVRAFLDAVREAGRGGGPAGGGGGSGTGEAGEPGGSPAPRAAGNADVPADPNTRA